MVQFNKINTMTNCSNGDFTKQLLRINDYNGGSLIFGRNSSAFLKRKSVVSTSLFKLILVKQILKMAKKQVHIV